MKTITLKSIYLVILCLLLSFNAMAYDFESGGIYYSIYGYESTVGVTSNSSKYTGDIIIPEIVEYNNKIYRVTSIGSRAFSECSGLTSITIPNSVNSIGDWAFWGCSGLTELTYNAKNCRIYDSDWLSSSKKSLQKVTIGNEVESIPNNIFSGCSGLTSITIPNSVTSIEYHAFSGCTGLTSITIPNSVTTIGGFSGCTGLTSVTIPTNVTSIGDNAFSECTGLTSITIGNSVTSIGSRAFSECSGLNSITIPNSVNSIGDYTFSGCSGLTEFIVDPNNPNYSSSDGILFDKGQAILLMYPMAKVGEYQIPNSVNTIGSSAFSECSGLTSITIGNSVTTIGDWAFSKCSKLTSITIGNSVNIIGYKAFSECSGLTSITIGNSLISTIMDDFYECTGLTEFIVDPNNPNYSSSDGILFDKGQAILLMYPMAKVGEYQIPNSVNTIRGGAFSRCSGLNSITIGNSVTSIGSRAFSECSGLNSITIPNSVNSIGDYTFSECSKLTSITIGNSVTSIGDYAFENCNNLIEINSLNKTAPLCGRDIASYKAYGLAILNIPKGSLSSYKADPEWSKFWNIKEVFDTGGLDVSTSAANTMKVYASQKNVIIKGAPVNTPIQIYSTSGQMIHSSKSTDDITTIAVSESGIYLIKIENNSYKVNLQ